LFAAWLVQSCMREIDPARLSTTDRYKLLIGGIVPRPIAFVSTMSPDGRLNLAPFSFFAGVSSEPMAMLFCPANNGDGSMKDTLRNAAPEMPALGASGRVGEAFDYVPREPGSGLVINVVTEAIERQMATCAEPLAYGESEFAMSGLTPAASHVVKAPRVAESPLSYECHVMRVMRLAPGVPSGGNIVLVRVVRIMAAEGIINDRYHVDPERLAAIGRMGGLGYTRTRDRFDMPMGKTALS
jgi:flavin reductase (DIM6/NTAB) family NADH-FMN oxidoreductase RutF